MRGTTLIVSNLETDVESNGLPSSSLLRRALRGIVDSLGPGVAVLDAARGLAELHDRRYGLSSWRDEDGLTDRQIVAYVGKVDEIDSTRAELVLAIDDWVARHVDDRTGASLSTESVGCVVDRLAQLWVQANRLLGVDDSDESAHGSWFRLAELADGYDDLVADVLAGRRRLPRW